MEGYRNVRADWSRKNSHTAAVQWQDILHCYLPKYHLLIIHKYVMQNGETLAEARFMYLIISLETNRTAGATQVCDLLTV